MSAGIRRSTWGVPILGALHVLALAWFGGAVLALDLRRLPVDLPDWAGLLSKWRWIGLAALLTTGIFLFAVEPLVCYRSVSFRVKIGLLALIGLNAWIPRNADPSSRARFSAGLSIALWIGIVFAARGIAFF